MGVVAMPKYLIEASYTADGLKGLQKNKASGRAEVVKKAIEALGGKLESLHYALGEYDVVVIADMPDIVSVTALSLGVSASGLVRTKTTALLTLDEVDKALATKITYRGPGQ